MKKLNLLFGIFFLGGFLILNSCQSHIDSSYDFERKVNIDDNTSVDNVSMSKSTVTVNKKSLKSAEMATITINLKDDTNSTVKEEKKIVCSYYGGTSTGIIGNTIYRQNGKYEAIFGAKKSGTATHIVCSLNSKKINSQPSITVTNGNASKIIIETTDDGTGSEVTTQVLNEGTPLTLYAISRDENNNFIATETVTWSESNELGKFSATTATSTTYTPNQGAGTTTITASHATLADYSTENITITWIVSSVGDLSLWLKADSLSLADGDIVENWRDHSVSNANMSQSTLNLRPIYHTNMQNGKPSITFDGSDDYMEAGDIEVHSNINGLTVIAVARAHDNTEANIFAKYGYGGAFLHREIKLANGYCIISPDGAHDPNYIADLSFTTNAFQIAKLIWTPGNSHDVYLDGNLEDTSIHATAEIQDLDASLVVGTIKSTDGSTTQFWNGEISEIIIYSKALTAGEQTSIRDYLCNKYNLDGCP